MSSNTRPPSPQPGAVPQHIADALGHDQRWVGWKYHGRRKVPVGSEGWASTTDSSTWLTLAEAAALEGTQGVGIVFTGDGLGGVDLDGCRDPETGEIASWAQEIVAQFRTYTEVSPSGTGLKLYAWGAPKDLPANTIPVEGPRINGKRPAVEAFTKGRYFAFTGEIVDGCPDEITDASDAGGGWDSLVLRLGNQATTGTRSEPVEPAGATDIPRELLEELEGKGKAGELWSKGKDGGGDRSKNDAALACTLAVRGYANDAIEAALRNYPLGQMGSGKLKGAAAERQVARLLGMAEESRKGSSTSPRTSIDGPWPEEPRVPGPPKPEALPVDALPIVIRKQVESVAASLQVPPDLPLLLALGALSAGAAGKVEVEPRRGWREPVGIYSASILPPASRKSPAFAAMTKPVRDWESEEMARAAPLVRAAQDLVEIAESRLAKTKKAAADGNADPEEVEADRLELERAMANVPPDGRLLAGDITPEAMTRRMAQQGGRLALLEPEPGPLQLLAGRYDPNKGARLDEIKKAWSGEAILVDRVGRPALRVERPALTLAICLQPGVLDDLGNGKAFRHEGVFGRFLWCEPDPGLGKRLTGPKVPRMDEEARAAFARVVRRILEAPYAGEGDDGTRTPHLLRLDAGALDILHAYEAEVERELGDGGRFAGIGDWAGKAVGQSLRVAALLELARRAEDGEDLFGDPIGPWAMGSAVRLFRALSTHALQVLVGIGMDKQTADLQYILRRLQELPHCTRESELVAAVKGRASIDGAGDVRELVTELEERGCLRRLHDPHEGAGRPKAPRLELHPSLRKKHPGNPENPPQEEKRGHFLDLRDADYERDERLGIQEEGGHTGTAAY